MLQDDSKFGDFMQQPEAPETHEKNSGAGSGIIGMLEVCESDSARIRANPPVRPKPAELGFGTAARIRPNSDLGRPPESGRTQIEDDRPNPAEKHIKHDRNQSFGQLLHVLGSNLNL